MQNFSLRCEPIFELETLLEVFIFHEKDLVPGRRYVFV